MNQSHSASESAAVLNPHEAGTVPIPPIAEAPSEPRPIGLGKGLAVIPDSFLDPLPDDLLDLFEGKAD